MAKRTATTELNHDNWNKEDDPEDAGTFSRASDDTLKKRVIKVARRRNPLSSAQSEDGKSSAFGSFAGFGKASSGSSGNFGFLTNIANKSETPKTNGTSEKEPDKKSDEYYAKLKGLNESVTEWIRKHVNTNPFINLQPVFKDYEKYFNDLEKITSEDPADKKEKSEVNTSTAIVPQFSFGTATTGSSSFPKFTFSATTSAPSTAFSFGTTTTASLNSSGSTVSLTGSDKPSFSFGNTPSSGSGKFTFVSTMVKPADELKNEQEDEDEPPKVEFTPVVEDGHIYSTRCKVFVKKDGSFVDHGVGTLYLKPVPDNVKVQLIVRAETNLGRLTCNFILSEGIPMQRMGKKDVMLVCIPTPEAQPPPVPILFRVKSSEDADELLNILQKHKK